MGEVEQYVVCDWANNLLSNTKFNTYEDALEFLYETDLDLDDTWLRPLSEFNETQLVRI